MNDSILMFVLLAVSVVIGGAMYPAGRISVADDCSHYGKSLVENRMIVCSIDQSKGAAP